MALLAEEIVEEWLRRRGFFTIRGAKAGVAEIDILAVRPQGIDAVQCWHVEVQCSINPVSYLLPLPRSIQRATGRAPQSAKRRSQEELQVGALEWVEKKFRAPKKEKLRRRLWPGGEWEYHLVVNELLHRDQELPALHNVMPQLRIHNLTEVLLALNDPHNSIAKAAGHDLCELVQLTAKEAPVNKQAIPDRATSER